MMQNTKQNIRTNNAPTPSGLYSQAIKSGNTIYLAGQIPLDPVTMQMMDADFRTQVTQVFKNLQAVCEASGTKIDNIVKLTVYLMDLNDFAVMNEVMTEFFTEPYPARTTIQVAALPKNSKIEVDAIAVF